METITLADYVQYGFLAFICLLLVTLVVGMLRQFRDTGEIKGELRGINKRLDDLTARVERLEDRVGRLNETVAALGREVSETKGLIVALHQRVDLVMRHRHDQDNGQVVLTPEEVAAD
jgi:chromosome segregation ATPase